MSCLCPEPNPHTDPRRAGTCIVCGRALGTWVVTDQFVRDFYESFRCSDATDEALTRLHRGADVYGLVDYLEKDCVQEAREEILDALHYAIFIVLRSRRDHDQEAAAVKVERARRASVKLVEALREFEAIRELER